jgi:hypothetical protein
MAPPSAFKASLSHVNKTKWDITFPNETFSEPKSLKQEFPLYLTIKSLEQKPSLDAKTL